MLSKTVEALAGRVQKSCTQVITKFYNAVEPIYFYVLLCIAFMLSTSGVIYNVINTPPPYSMERVGENEVQAKFIASGMMTQYSTEGYISGILNLTAGVSLVMTIHELRSKRCSGRLAAIYVVIFCFACVVQKNRYSKKTGM